MTQQEELDLYKKALIDWEKPIEECDYNCTQFGFCWYFDESGKYEFEGCIYNTFKVELPILFNQRLIKRSDCHYLYEGRTNKGRQQRVQALKNAIEILETQLKQEV